MDLSPRPLRVASKAVGIALAAGLLSAGVGACANQSTHSRSASHPPATGPKQASSAEYVVTPASKYLHLKGPALRPQLTRRLLGYSRIPLPNLKEYSLMFAYYYGQPASAADTRAAAQEIGRYYQAASRGEGQRACSIIAPALAKSMPVEYGKFGPAYEHGANTCQAVLGRMFRKHHSSLTLPPTVRGLLAHGSQGYAFISSNKMPVSLVELERSGSGWKIDTPLAGPVPLSFAATR